MDTKRSGAYLTFRVAHQEFVMRSARVRALLPAYEVIPLETPVSWICGVIAAGRRDCPVIDVRARLGLAPASPGRQPIVVVTDAASPDGMRLFGFVADRVSDVIQLRERDFRGEHARINGKLRRVFDPDLLLADEDLWSHWRSALACFSR